MAVRLMFRQAQHNIGEAIGFQDLRCDPHSELDEGRRAQGDNAQ